MVSKRLIDKIEREVSIMTNSVRLFGAGFISGDVGRSGIMVAGFLFFGMEVLR